MTKKNYLFAIALITSLFFLWGIALNLNSILVPHLKKACELTDLQSAFVDSAFYLAYFVIAIPAGLFMHKFGYKKGIVFGLILFATGAFLFYPAAETRTYAFFLFALFIMASGCGTLETAANPYINNLGEPEGATQRINFAQSFNGLAATLAPFLGGYLFFQVRT
ncbi:MFS transporter [Mucilaginibacter ginsenosidivorans]|uniref:MFS transporter n=1 Tax=Mucilaginibacter ginsenosidivorans TaxID=398053 RepID=UPI001E625D03|nr:MFS transporter [Mucilaginibacter ginsenosidivorans]